MTNDQSGDLRSLRDRAVALGPEHGRTKELMGWAVNEIERLQGMMEWADDSHAKYNELRRENERLGEVIARCYMRLQAADVPREPWHWEVCTTLDNTGIPSAHEPTAKPCPTCLLTGEHDPQCAESGAPIGGEAGDRAGPRVSPPPSEKSSGEQK